MNEKLVEAWMTPDPIVVAATERMLTAYEVMEVGKVRHLPVVMMVGSRRVVGLVTKNSLRQAELETAVLYSQSEIRNLASSLKAVGEVMITPFPFVAPDDPITKVAKLMLDQKLTGMPVIANDELVGIITESDIFRYLLSRETVRNGR